MPQSQSSLQRLATAPVGRLLWQYSLPAVVGMVVMALYNVVDRVFVGQVVGPEAIAGMALTFPLMNIATAVGVLVGAGASARVSIALGARKIKSAELILGNAVTLTVINGIIYISLFIAYLDTILDLFGAGAATMPYAREYMLWVLPGMWLTNVAFGLNNIMRSSAYPTRAMMTMIIGAVTNVALDCVFVLWLDWGMAGAALATDLAMAASSVFVIWHFFKPGVNLRFRRHTFGLKIQTVAAIISIGAAPAVVNLAACLVNALVNRALADHGGDMAIGAAGIFVTATSLMVTIVLGISMGLQAVLGYNYGAGLFGRLRKAFWLAVGVSTLICTLGSLMGMVFPEIVARAFTKSEFLIDTTRVCLRHALWAFSVVGFQIISTTLFQSIGAPGKATLLGLVRQVIFLIPLMMLLPRYLGVEGVWLSFPISDLLATIVTAALVFKQFKNFA